MKTVLVYDSNNLDSLMGAACVASVHDVIPCDCRSFPPMADKYVWLGVIPTIRHFPNIQREAISKVHSVIARVSSIKDLEKHQLPDVDYLYSLTNENTESVSFSKLVNNYGERTLTERVLIHFNIDPESFTWVIYAIKEFYKLETPIELIHAMALNAKEALHCLETQDAPYMTIPYRDGFIELAAEIYEEYDRHAKRIIKDRGQMSWIQTRDGGNRINVFTFYEQTLWWFIKRRFFNQKVILRNVSVSATGTQVISELPYLDGIYGTNPVFVY